MTTITLHEQRFKKNPNTKTTYILEEEHTEKITYEQYMNFKNSIGWFRRTGGTEKTEYNYTSIGYSMTKLTSTSPDKQIKIIRKFKFDGE